MDYCISPIGWQFKAIVKKKWLCYNLTAYIIYEKIDIIEVALLDLFVKKRFINRIAFYCNARLTCYQLQVVKSLEENSYVDNVLIQNAYIL